MGVRTWNVNKPKKGMVQLQPQGDVYIFQTFYIGKEFGQIIPNTAAAFTVIDTAHMSYSTLCMKFLHRSFQADWFGSNKMD